MFSKNTHDKINSLSLLLIAFTLPYHVLLCSYSIALFVLNQLFEGNLGEKWKALRQNRYIGVLLLFFIFHLIGLLYTENLSNGLFEIEKKAGLFILPAFLYSCSIKPEQTVKILMSFVLSCGLLGFFFLVNASYNYYLTGNPENFILQNLSSPTGMHRVYASMYFLFCIFILLYLEKNKEYVKIPSLVLLSLMVYFTILIFLLASRMIVLLTLVSLIVMISRDLILSKKYTRGILLLTALLLLSGSLLVYNERTRTVLKETYESLDKGNSEANYTGPNMRIIIWKTSWEIASAHLFGVGTGDAEDALYQRYARDRFKWGIIHKFNAHNQYLQTMIELGVAGLSVLLTCLIWAGFYSYKKRQYLFTGFILLFSVACLTESMLATQKGIIFFAFFNALMAFHYPKKSS